MLIHPATSHLRIALLDVLRGVAIAAMVVYHSFFDLELFGLAYVAVSEHWGWIAFVRTIPASFLAVAGISLYLAHHNGMHWRNFWWRIGYLVAAAMLVTIISYFVDPDAIIWFGILHCIALSSVIGLAFLRAPLPVIILAAIVVLIGPLFATPLLNAPILLWLGLGTEAPPSNDYNPLFPWFGFMLIGIAVARILAPYATKAVWAHWQPVDVAGRVLALAGRHSLLIYLLHQPILMGVLFGVSQLAAAG
ncbi:DUF1624 domain-containing protein [Pseudorhodoplanes sinuspersici]|uniref:Uncharacterized protein n=1 Tax=Pseudorhodoplanes sinuspersici TaxID=1235591 RepID=A0A1W6ZSY7_9HYPH|nr:heparan-alpha-glucosaminide N-acetyltransferase [Pseudorhodoplanes sinuspersici]ARQ00463.1 hypothetical protein CAK95_16280 [Pseudorhodoplanes sinuspersici]RKE67363.1 putative membrane protein [Pseudorhodoplanes sinuspersici]